MSGGGGSGMLHKMNSASLLHDDTVQANTIP